MFNTAKQNYWRVAEWYEFEDLIQDGFMVFHRIVNRYENVKTPKHIMALFKTSFTNHIHDLAKKRTQQQAEQIESTLATVLADVLTDAFIPPDTSVTVASLPPVFRALIKLLESNDPRLHRPYRYRPDHRETANERLCRLLGLDNCPIPLRSMLRQHLSGEPAV